MRDRPEQTNPDPSGFFFDSAPGNPSPDTIIAVKTGHPYCIDYDSGPQC